MSTEAEKVLQARRLAKKDGFVFYVPETAGPVVDPKPGFALARTRAGILGVTWHTLRHTFTFRLLDRGADVHQVARTFLSARLSLHMVDVDVVTVKEWLGHSTVTMTIRYTHTNLDSQRAAVVTMRPKSQQSRPRPSANRVLSYNFASS